MTVKNYQDESSPHFLAKFEFVAENLESAKQYQESLRVHHKENMPFRPDMPWTATEILEIEVQ